MANPMELMNYKEWKDCTLSMVMDNIDDWEGINLGVEEYEFYRESYTCNCKGVYEKCAMVNFWGKFYTVACQECVEKVKKDFSEVDLFWADEDPNMVEKRGCTNAIKNI